jgi:peptide/nickel transport system permease protein
LIDTSGRERETVTAPAVTPRRRALRRFMRNRVGLVAFGYLVFIILVAIFGRLIIPHNPNSLLFQPFLGPSGRNWLGTDDLGRDIASRIIAGDAVSIQVAFQSVGLAVAIALPVGLIAGYRGGWVDNVLMRVMDTILSFPALILALVIASLLGPSPFHASIAITIVMIPAFVRLTRASTLAVTQETFIEASRSIGTRTHVILFRRLLPSVVSPIIILASLSLGTALLVEAMLSFLGLGILPPNASWGNMLQESYQYLLSRPYQIVPPGVALALAILSFNLVGDALRDALGPGAGEAPPARRAERGRLGVTRVAPRAEGKRQESSLTPAPLLAVRDLQIEFATPAGLVTVVDGMNFEVMPGEVVGLLGESGSGKTVTAMAIMRLLTSPPARISGGQVLFGGQDLLQLSFKELADVRGNSLSMVFQDPMASLNPAFTIGNQLVEAVRLHQSCLKRQSHARALEMLDLVGIADPVSRMKEYPHRLSGGMRQRVLIAMALVNRPKLLIADEPTTALDVTVQAQILDLLKSMRKEFDMAMIFVSHDLGVIADIADRAIVMYAGQLVESAPVAELFATPGHPYTRRLLSAIPQAAPVGRPLPFIPGVVPAPGDWPGGCRFASRCEHASAECEAAPIQLSGIGSGHAARCIKVTAVEAGTSS